MACQVVADAVRTTLGPRGMDKLIVDAQGKVFSFFPNFFSVKRKLLHLQIEYY